MPDGLTPPLRAAKTVAAWTLVSRILGLIRDAGTAALFGASWIWDAFCLAFLIPNLFRRLFGEGALSASFVPRYVQTLQQRGPMAAARLVTNALGVLTAGLSLVTVLIIAAAWFMPDAVFAWVVTDDVPHKIDLLRLLIPLLAPFVVLICATALLGGALNVHGNFVVPALAQVVQNLTALAGIGVALAWVQDPVEQVVWIGGSILAGALLGQVHHQWALRRALSRLVPQTPLPRVHVDPADKDLRAVLANMGPAMLGLGLLQICTVLDSLFAEIFVPGDGAVSALYYGNRLMQFPLALIGFAMGAAVFPLFAKQAANQDTAGLLQTLSRSVRLTLFLAIPATAGMIVFADPIVEALFRRGAFDAKAQERTMWVVVASALGIIPGCLRMVQSRAFFALGDTKTPAVIAGWLVGLNVALNWVLVQTPLAEAGLALSTSLGLWIGAGAMSWALRRKGLSATVALAPGAVPHRRAEWRCVAKSMLATVGMVAVGCPLAQLIGAGIGGWHQLAWPLRLGALSTLILIALIVFAIGAWFLRANELREWLRRG